MNDQSTAAGPLDRAAQRALLNESLPPSVRLRHAKALVLRLLRVLSNRQQDFNVAAVDALTALDQAQQRHATELAALGQRVSDSENRLGDLEHGLAGVQQLHGLQERTEAAEAELWRLRQDADRLRSDTAVQRGRVDGLVDELRGRLSELGMAQPQTLSDDANTRLDDFYSDFEHLFRGSADSITAQQREYLPLVQATAELGDVVDLGAGRGEWLALLAETGIPSYGVDTNALFVTQAEAHGLRVVQDDAVAHLRQLEEGTVRAVTGFHIAEHLPFEVLVTMVDAALRALRPGGFLLLETPNPQNLHVGTSSFWLDPTHLRPLPPPLMQFLLRARGFSPVQVRFLHPDEPRRELPPRDTELHGLLVEVDEALHGARDYSVIGWKPVGPVDQAEATYEAMT